jgi:Trypsin-like peptidase domain
MYFGEQQLSTGSCFFWEHDSRIYLITNWHNFAGKNPLTDEFMSDTLGIPDRIFFSAYKQTSEPDADGYYELNYLPVEVQLYEKDFTNPKWLEHPTYGRRVDIAAIDVTNAVAEFQIKAANLLENDAILDPVASQDVFVIGFPFGQIANAPAPIWKRGTIALDPTFDPESLPKMLIDTATRKGMSGSVVIARHILVGRDYQKKDGHMSEKVLYSKLDLVIGIYSGRIDNFDLEKAQLGIVWKRSAIEETVTGSKFASL